MNNQQNKPQDNVLKGLKTPYEILGLSDHNFSDYPKPYFLYDTCVKSMEEYAAPLQSRISELEAKNKECREALEWLYSHAPDLTGEEFENDFIKAIKNAEQALKPKGDG